MQQRLAQFIRESVNDKNVNVLPDEPRNFNFKFTGNLGPTSLNRQLQLDDTIKEKQNTENEYINFSIDRIEQQQMRKHGMSRLRQKRLNYTNKINALRLTNAKYNERINILQPTGQETALPRQTSVIGAPLKQLEMMGDKSAINKLLKLLGDDEDKTSTKTQEMKPPTKTQEMKQILDNLERNEQKSEQGVQERADQEVIEFTNLTQEQLDEKYAGAGAGVEEEPLFTDVPEADVKAGTEAGTQEDDEEEEIDTGSIDERNERLKKVYPQLKNIGNAVRKVTDKTDRHYVNIVQKITENNQDINQFEQDLRSYVNSIKYKAKQTQKATIGKLEKYIEGVRKFYENK